MLHMVPQAKAKDWDDWTGHGREKVGRSETVKSGKEACK